MQRNVFLFLALAALSGTCAALKPGDRAAAGAPGPAADDRSIWMAVSDRKLGTLRGGFVLGGGLVASFAITRAVYINDQLVTQTTLNFGRVTDLTPAQSAELSRQLGSVSVVQNGPRNAVDSSQGGAAAGLIIQNSLNNQQIRQQTVIDASSNSMGMIKNLNMQSTIADGVARAAGPR